MLSTKETVSGTRKLLTIADALVKKFPDLPHGAIARLILDEYGNAVDTLKADIKAAIEADKNPYQKAASLKRLESYGPIVGHLESLFVELGKPEIVETEVKAA